MRAGVPYALDRTGMRKFKASDTGLLRTLVTQAVRNSDAQRYLHRLHCVLLASSGCSCYDVATWFGESPRTIERWVASFESRGADALRTRHSGGRPSRLTTAQSQEVAAALLQPPSHAGFSAQRWNGELLLRHVRSRYGIDLSLRQCQRILRKTASGADPS